MYYVENMVAIAEVQSSIEPHKKKATTETDIQKYINMQKTVHVYIRRSGQRSKKCVAKMVD